MLTKPAMPAAEVESTKAQRALELVGDISRCNGTGTITDLLMEGLRPFGISTYAVWTAANPERVDPLANMLSNWPAKWADIYRSERKYLYDPVVLEAVRKPGNFFWRDISVPPHSLGGELFKQARQFGMIDGFTMSFRAQWPVVTALSVSGQELNWDEAEEGAVTLLAHTFMSRAMYIRQEELIPTITALTDQQRRILRLAAQGQPDKSISLQLGIRASTLLTHWERLREKLGAEDRAKCVAIALWSGQLTII